MLILERDIFETEQPNPFGPFLQGSREEQINHFVDVTMTNIMAEHILSEQDRPVAHWQVEFIDLAYTQGVRRGETELRKGGFLRTGSMRSIIGNNPVHSGRLSSSRSRTFSELEGIVAAVKQNLKRILSDELPFKANVSLSEIIWEKVKKVLSVIGLNRHKVLSNTETVRTHHKAILGVYSDAGITDVVVLAEFTTAGDDKVCPECSALEGKIFTLEAIENIIPVHPNCRCIALPVEVERPKINKKVEVVEPTAPLPPEVIIQIEKETKIYKDANRGIISPRAIERVKSNFIGSALDVVNEVIDQRKGEVRGIREVENREDGTVIVYYTDGTGEVLCNLKGKEGGKGDDGIGITGISEEEEGDIAIHLTDGSVQKINCRGKEGESGVGIQNISTFERTLVVELTDGRKWSFETLAGLDGGKGDDGKAGVGIKEVGILEGNLVLAYTNGGIHNLGKVAGTDGEDGLGVVSANINEDNELILGMTNGKEVNAGSLHVNQEFLEDFEFSRARNAIRWMKHGRWSEWMNIPRSGGGGVITRVKSDENSITISPANGRGDIDLSFVGHVFAIDTGKTLTIPTDIQFDHLGSFNVNGRKVINGRFVLGIGANA